jgi:transposase
MVQRRLTVRQIKELLRLHFEEHRSNREIGMAISRSPSVVSDCLTRFKANGLIWPLPEEIDEETLEARMYVPKNASTRNKERMLPDFEWVHQERSKKHVTLYLLWQEYKLKAGEAGYQHSQFCELYKDWAAPLGAVMRFRHKAGEKSFVDWSGDGIEIQNRETGEILIAPFFVGVLGASGYAFAKAAPNRQSFHWLNMHSEMMAYFGGVTAAVIPDNEKTGVTSPCLYDPQLNPVYAAWAAHFGTAVIPARPQKPRDKAMVENAVLIAQRWILARLRNQTFFSVEQANAEVAKLLVEYNDRPMQKTGTSRRTLFEQLDRPALRPLPNRPFEPFDWSSPKVNIDYHVTIEKNHYSVPYTLIGKKLEARMTGTTVELFHKGRRVATHLRCYKVNEYCTLAEHRPANHQAPLDWTPERMKNWAEKSGPSMALLVEKIIASKPHPEQGFRACLGVLRLSKKYGQQRTEAACTRALTLGSPKYQTVQSILKSGADMTPLPQSSQAPIEGSVLPKHENIRGKDYFH